MLTQRTPISVTMSRDTTDGMLELLQHWYAELGKIQRAVGTYRTFRDHAELNEIEDLSQGIQVEVQLTQAAIVRALHKE